MQTKRKQTVSELQKFLRDRGVTFANTKKYELLELCTLAEEVGLQVDPDNFIEDRDEIIGAKLTDHVDGTTTALTNPSTLDGYHSNLSVLPAYLG